MSWDLNISDIVGIVTLITGLVIGLATSVATYKKGTVANKVQKVPNGIPISLSDSDRNLIENAVKGFEKALDKEIQIALSSNDRVALADLSREIQHLSIALNTSRRG